MVSWMSWKLGIMFGGGSWPACRQRGQGFQQRHACTSYWHFVAFQVRPLKECICSQVPLQARLREHLAS